MRMTLAALAVLALCPAAGARRLKPRELVQVFNEAKNEERARLAAALGRAKDDRTTAALILAFNVKKGSPVESAAYVEALGYAGDRRAVEPIAAAWDHLRSMTLQTDELPGGLQVLRGKILESLSRLGGDQAVRTLFEALNDKDPRVVEEAVRGLGRLRVRDAVPALQQLAPGASGNLLQAIVEAFGDIGDKRALSSLDQAIASPDKFVEVQVAYARAKLGKGEGVLRLESGLTGDPGEDKLALLAAYYLVKLDEASGLAHLEKTMRKEGSPLAAPAADALGKAGNPRAALVLVGALKAADPAVRMAAARSLARLGGPRASTALRKLRGDPHPGVRSAAIVGLADLGEFE